MILVEIRPRGGGKPTTITVHPKVTVLAGLDSAARQTWATDLGRALQGRTAASIDLDVDLDGDRRRLTPEVADTLGLGDAGCEVTVFPLDLPGAAAAVHESEPEPESEPEANDDATLATATRALEDATSRLAKAEQDEAAAVAERDAAAAEVDPSAAAALPGCEEAVETARAETERARRAVEDTETRIARVREMAAAERAEAREALQRLEDERARLESARTEIVARMVEVGDPGDPKAVEGALAGLRRLRSVRPKPSARALELADAWVEAYERLASLTAPPQPPEWLVTPALTALQEAKEAVADAERGGPSVDVDPALVQALDRAHGEVLDAEQRVMRKGSRSNRKRLDAAHHFEQQALAALGVATYGEYLQRIAPNLEGGGVSGEERLAAARAALADAEAVWEELHDGQASPEWTAAKQHQAGVRQEAHELIEKDVDDADLEAALRGHVETVVDTGWAEQELVDALEAARVPLPMPADEATAADLEAVADAWLQASPAQRELRATLESELATVDDRYSLVEEKLAAKQADHVSEVDEDDDVPDTIDGSPSLSSLRESLAVLEEDERRAEGALEVAKRHVAASEVAEARRLELEQTLGACRRAVAAAREDVAAAESALADAVAAAAKAREEAAAAAAAAAEKTAKAGANGAADLSHVVGMEAEAYLLARVAALRGAAAGPLPLVLDGAVLSGLSERAAKRVYRLLSRLAESMQLVVLADDEETTRWAEGLGESAAVHSVKR